MPQGQASRSCASLGLHENGKVSTHCRSAVEGGSTRSIRFAAVALIRRPMHDGQNPRPLQLKASSRVSPHARHFSRAKPRARSLALGHREARSRDRRGVPSAHAGGCGPPAPHRQSHRTESRGCRVPPRRAPWSRADGAGRQQVRRRFWVAGWQAACHATMPVGGRALLALLALTCRTVETAGRNTARNLDPAFWHADSREFEGEASGVSET